MYQPSSIEVFSEIGKLKEILLHRPGVEMENITPDYLHEFLLDDIMHLRVAQQEHDVFAKILDQQGVAVRYVETLMAQAMQSAPEQAKLFVEDYLKASHVLHPRMRQWIQEWLFDSWDAEGIISRLIAGIRTDAIPTSHEYSFLSMMTGDHPFVVKPLPNLLFTRDPMVSIGNGLAFGSMKKSIRQREPLLSEFIFTYHPHYKDSQIPSWFDHMVASGLEGGDFLIINESTLFVGISERTDADSVELLAMNLFANERNKVRKVVAFVIPKIRSFMHLDTVFTQIDYDKFTIHAGIEDALTLFTITPSESGHSLSIREEHKGLQELLNQTMGCPVTLFRCGNGDIIAGAREQWNDGANTLAIAPGKVCVYDRNYVTNQLLKDNGITVYEIPSSELSRGRGGPRCMSMPLQREPLKQ